MVDDPTVLKLERLRDDLSRLKVDLRKKYPGPTGRRRQVTASALKEQAGRLAEIWLVDVAARRDLLNTLEGNYVGDLTVHFTRLLTMSQQAAIRSSYETEIVGILKDFTIRVIIPLKRARSVPTSEAVFELQLQRQEPPAFVATAFLGHSFADLDSPITAFVQGLLEAIGIKVVTGGRPRAARISEKVKRLIDEQHIFVGLFTKGDRISGRRNAWTTSSWVIDEKAYAVAKNKVLVLLTEEGVDSIGGLQGDAEYIRFARDRLDQLGPKLIGLFQMVATGMT